MDIDLSLDTLKAFLKIAELKNMSRAAKLLGITQPALSLKIKAMETTLERILFRRSRQGMALTIEGENLVRYAQARLALQQDLATRMLSHGKKSGNPKAELTGTIRIAGHYSIVKHAVVPSLQTLFRMNADLQLHVIIKEDVFVPDMLRSNQVDFAILLKPLSDDSFENVFLGHEEYVAVESKNSQSRDGVYLDSDPLDTMTEKFFSQQASSKPKSYQRSFFHDESGIAQAVALGYGRAVLAKNEALSHKDLRILKDLKSYRLPAYLHYPRQAFYSRAQLAVREALTQGVRAVLDQQI